MINKIKQLKMEIAIQWLVIVRIAATVIVLISIVNFEIKDVESDKAYVKLWIGGKYDHKE